MGEKVEESEESEAEVIEEEKDEPSPKVTLDADEKKNFRVAAIQDLTAYSMSSSFTKFTIPEKDEGFDEIQYEWTKTGTKCQEFMKNWVLDKKAANKAAKEAKKRALVIKAARDKEEAAVRAATAKIAA